MAEKIEAIIFDWVGTLYQFGEKGLFPYSEKVLQRLKPRYKLAVISKAVSDNIMTRIKQVRKIKKYFKVIFVCNGKTSTQFIECMRKLNVRPENTLVVDDRVDGGIQIGNRLGCQTYWIRNGKYSEIIPNEETGQPTKTIKSVENLLTIL